MHVRKALMGIIAGAVLTLALAPTAGARFISLSSTSFRAILEVETRTNLVRTALCRVTLEGTFIGRTLTKVLETEIGSITRIASGGCAAGEIRWLTETLPWPMRYRVFTGTLPTITSIRANADNVSFRVREQVGGGTCLYESETAEPVIVTFLVNGGRINGFRLGGEIVRPCTLRSTTIAGAENAIPTVLNETANINVTLI